MKVNEVLIRNGSETNCDSVNYLHCGIYPRIEAVAFHKEFGWLLVYVDSENDNLKISDVQNQNEYNKEDFIVAYRLPMFKIKTFVVKVTKIRDGKEVTEDCVVQAENSDIAIRIVNVILTRKGEELLEISTED